MKFSSEEKFDEQHHHRQSFESFEQWRAQNVALAALMKLPARVQSQLSLSEEALSQLRQGAQHPNPKVRWWCAHLADHLADDRCVDVLLRLSQDEVGRVRAEAIHAIGCARCKPCPLDIDATGILVVAALTDVEAKVRAAAIFTLGYLPADPRAAQALAEIAQGDLDKKLRQAAARALKYHVTARPSDSN